MRPASLTRCLALTAAVAVSGAGLSQTREAPGLTVEAAQRFARSCAKSAVVAGVTCLTGTITRDMATAFAAASSGDVFLVVVDSEGGDAEAALDIADEMSRSGASIVVSGQCLSACANYLFIAAAEKVVLDGSYVGFHGGVTYDGPVSYSFVGAAPTEAQRAAAVRSAERSMQALADRQAAFFKRVGVNQDLIFRPPPGYDPSRRDHLFWEYGPRALSGFGVSGISHFRTPDQEPTWRRLLSHVIGTRCDPDGEDAWLCST